MRPRERDQSPSPFANGAVPLVLITSLHEPLNNSALTTLGAARAAPTGRYARITSKRSSISSPPAGSGRQSSRRFPARGATGTSAATAEPVRILVVDDVELNLMVARAMLGSLGTTVFSAGGGHAALVNSRASGSTSC